MSCFFGISKEQEKVNELNSEITSLKKEVLQLKQANNELKDRLEDRIVYNNAVHSSSDDTDNDDDNENDNDRAPNEDSKSNSDINSPPKNSPNKESELKQQLQQVTKEKNSLLKQNEQLSENLELYQTTAEKEIERLRAKLQAIENVKNDYFKSESNAVSSSLNNEIQDLKAQNEMLQASQNMLKQKNESQQKMIDNLKQQLKDGKHTKSDDEEKVESKPKKHKKYNLNKAEDQIEVLYSESLKCKSLILVMKPQFIMQDNGYRDFSFLQFLETSMSDKVIDQLFSKFKSDWVDGKQLEQLLTLTVIIYKVKLHKLRTGSTDKPKLESSAIKRSVQHLTSWIIRKYGNKSEQKKSISIKSDMGEIINGEYFVYNARFDKNQFGNDIKDWVLRYVEDDGYLKIE